MDDTQFLLKIYTMYDETDILSRWLKHKPKKIIQIASTNEIDGVENELVKEIDKLKQDITNFPLDLLISGYTRMFIYDGDDDQFEKDIQNFIDFNIWNEISKMIVRGGKIQYIYFKCNGYKDNVQPYYKNHPYQGLMTPVTSDEEEEENQQHNQ